MSSSDPQRYAAMAAKGRDYRAVFLSQLVSLCRRNNVHIEFGQFRSEKPGEWLYGFGLQDIADEIRRLDGIDEQEQGDEQL